MVPTFFNLPGSMDGCTLSTFTATISPPDISLNTSEEFEWVHGCGLKDGTSYSNVQEVGNTPHDPHSDRKRWRVYLKYFGG